jgi:hypothetical protein
MIRLKEIRERIKKSNKERNRYFVLAIGCLFILNYLMFCYHTGKNIFDIFPSIPVLDDKQQITVYLPSLDGKSIISEKRDVPKFKDDFRYVKYLFGLVARGSVQENTSQAVPVSLFVKKVWIEGKKRCILDLDVDPLRTGRSFAEGSEELFKKSLQKTLTENIPGMNSVEVLVHGIPGRKLWEI